MARRQSDLLTFIHIFNVQKLKKDKQKRAFASIHNKRNVEKFYRKVEKNFSCFVLKTEQCLQLWASIPYASLYELIIRSLC